MKSTVVRALDVALSLAALIVLAPLLVVVAIAVRLSLGAPVLFRQARAGRHNRVFQIVKFRTMRDALAASGEPLPDEQRLTAFGRLLRKSSVDELPELFNVLRGDMSLVGPRPLFPHYFDHYTERERRRLEVRPGITGLAQISGRNYLGWDRKLSLDVDWVERFGVGLYLKVLLLTPLTVLDWRKVAANPYTAEQPLDLERAGAKREDRS